MLKSFCGKNRPALRCVLLSGIIVGLILTMPLAGLLRAEEFPSREIKLVVPLAPGGGVDVPARMFADKVAKILGVPVTVVNNTAGGGVAGVLSVVQAKPDGYTLLYTPSGQIITKELLNPSLPFRHTDFTAIAQTIVMPVAIFVKQDAPWKNLKELVDYGKKNPGQLRVSVGTAGGFLQTLTDFFISTAGIEITAIPTKGGASQIAALIGGHAEICTDAFSTAVSFLRAGKVRALVGTHKIAQFPAIKTFAEEGYPQINLKMWHGIFGAKNMPKNVVTKLTEAFEKASSDPSLREQLGKLNIIPDYHGPEETAKLVISERDITSKVLKQSGVIK